MCSINLIAMKETTAKNQHVGVDRRSCKEQGNRKGSLRMNWVVTIDENGNRQLHMCWRADSEPIQ